MSRKLDYYEILGVSRTASADQIKRAYRKLAKKHHPDRNPGDPTAEQKFKEVQQANSILSDSKKRAEYDSFGEAGVGRWATGQRGQKVYQWGANSSVNADDLADLFSAFGGGTGRPSSPFEQIFGGGRQQRPMPKTPQRGADLQRTISLSFEQTVHGAAVDVKLHPKRNGRPETLAVKIPAGVEEGQKIRLPGRGHPGTNGGPPGDFYLVCSIRPHAYFTREGADVHLDAPVTVTEAALGATIEVPTIDGTATVKLPPGTAGGAKLRLKNCGLKRPGASGRGDQFIAIRIVPPTSLTDEQRRLFEQLSEQDRSDPRTACGWKLKPAK